MLFKDIIGQQQVKQNLAELVQHNRLSHALLFLGKEGSGALPLATAFSQYVVCEKVNKKSIQAKGHSLFEDEIFFSESKHEILYDSCGVCPACLKASHLAHPDIHFSYPVVSSTKKKKEDFDVSESDEGKKKGNRASDFINEWREFISESAYGAVADWIEKIKETPNQQGKITANECYEIVRNLNLKSFESEYKIVVLWMPEMLAKEANILLKSLEEPPANTLFILVAENESLILPTILSRCQVVRIPVVETAEIEKALIERNNTDASTARQVASVSEGNYREALHLLKNTDENWQSLLRDWLNAILKKGPIAQTKWVEEISKLGREKQKQFLRYFNHLLEQAIRLKIIGDQNLTDNSASINTERDFAQRLNNIAGLEQQQAIIEELDKATYYIERNANAKMLFHALTIKVYHIIQDKIVFLTD